jgi:hypothetical protein
MDNEEPQNNVRIGWGKFSLSAHGPTVIFVLGVGALLASNYVLNMDRRHEHMMLLGSHDLMTCVLTLSQEQRDEFRRSYRPGTESIWCPWIRADR